MVGSGGGVSLGRDIYLSRLFELCDNGRGRGLEKQLSRVT
jgi:hypothetical protein